MPQTVHCRNPEAAPISYNPFAMLLGKRKRPPAPNAAPPWHALGLAEIFRSVASGPEGLTSAEAARRLLQVGPNVLPQKPPPPAWLLFIRQFNSPLIYILAAAAIVSGAMGDLKDAGFILAVLLLNAVIGTWQEWRAERESQGLQKLLRVRAQALRDGEARELPAEELVPGDVVLLESGLRVPADLRLLESNGLEADESFLTGESIAARKDAGWSGPESTVAADRRNLAHAGSMVTRGRARGVVVATGRATEVGRLAVHIQEAGDGKPPLVHRMERFSRVLAAVMLVAAVAVAVLGIVAQDRGAQEMFFFAVALAVAAIPEGLPAALTVALSVASSRMAKRGAVVRRLPAVEALGSCTVIASDKTGTLTCNELTVREVVLPDGSAYQVTGEGFSPVGGIVRSGDSPAADASSAPSDALADLVHAGLLNNEGDLHPHRERVGEWAWRGDPTDIALLALARKVHGLEEERGHPRKMRARHPERAAIPFEAENRYSATWHGGFGAPDGSGQRSGRVFVKGAPERVLGMCQGADSAALLAKAEEMAARGLRVLALAEGDSDHSAELHGAPPEPSGLRFLGFIGMIDPLRAGVPEAVAQCREAGIRVWMVTGDHPVTALAIARDLGMADSPDQVVTGTALAGMTQQEIVALIRRSRDSLVFARVSPEQKLQLVQAARAAGHFVAVTGDGVNDAPALRAAHIGVAMGRSGTDTAREAAAMALSDDNFATLVAGVEEGRIAYQNVRNVVLLLVSTGAAELVIALLAVGMGMPLPLVAVQLLWLNLVTNGIQGVALAFEPGHGGELRRKPRPPGEPVFDRVMIERVLISAAVMGGLGYGLFHWLLDSGWSEGAARNVLLLYMVIFENVHIGNCRSERDSAFRFAPWRSPFLLGGTLAAFAIHVAFMHLPFGRALLGVEPVDLKTYALLFLLALPVLGAVEAHKAWARRRSGD